MWMVYKHKNVHMIIKTKVLQFFVDLTCWMIRENCEQKLGFESPWWSPPSQKKERDRFDVVEEEQFEDFTGWKCKHGGTSRITKRNWLDGEPECSSRTSLIEVAKNANKMIWKTQDVPCQGNMEYNWMYRGEEGHWISLVGKNAKIGQTEIRKKETETRICAL